MIRPDDGFETCTRMTESLSAVIRTRAAPAVNSAPLGNVVTLPLLPETGPMDFHSALAGSVVRAARTKMAAARRLSKLEIRNSKLGIRFVRLWQCGRECQTTEGTLTETSLCLHISV